MSIRGAEGAGASAKERRAGGGQRIHFEALVAVGEAEGGGFEAESVDVSPDGMRLRTAYLPEVGDKIVCRFDGMGTEVVAEAEVVWREEQAKGGEFGLRFVGLDAAAAEAVRAMCAQPAEGAEDAGAAEPPGVPRGSRVRLHIEGLGSPMKARVRESTSAEVQIGSNLEFLKVGRSLELEDVDQGSKREAHIDDVKVDVDPATNVPQLVVTLRFEGAPAKKREKARSSIAPPTRRAAAGAATAPMTMPKEDAAAKAEAEPDPTIEVSEEQDAEGFGAKAALAGRAVASRLVPALAGAGARAKGAMSSITALLEQKRAARAEARKAAAPRRTTAPPPAGALTAEGRRVVRDDGTGDDDDPPPPRTNRRAAAVGGAMGLMAVLAIFGAMRFVGGRAHAPAAAASDRSTAAAALPAAPDPPGAASGAPTANVPLFGATPLSTTEPAPAAPSAAPSSSAVAGAPATPPATDGDDDPAPSGGGPVTKEWGQGTVQHPVVLKIKMDGPIEGITGAAGAAGFTLTVPNRRSVSTTTDLAHKDKRLASVNVVNTSKGAEVTVQFKDGVPPYLAKVKGDRLEIALGKETHSKVAKSKKKKKSKKDE
jgi:hypothetical protein